MSLFSNHYKEWISMNDTQKALLAVYLPLTVLVAVLDDMLPEAAVVKYVKYTIIVSIFLVSLIVKKQYREQKIMSLALLFVMLADFFLVFATTLHLRVSLASYGVLCFFLAYLCLIYVYQKNFKIGKAEIITAVPILVAFVYVFYSLSAYLNGVILISAFIFGVALSYMTWTSVCTLFRGYFSKRAAVLIAVSGVCMFICDLGVAYSLLDPDYFINYAIWQKNIVWSAYLFGWALLDVIICEDNLKIDNKKAA